MPSPFPGMDPYLERPSIWPHVHTSLANELSNQLNVTLPSPYYARLELRPEVGVVEELDPPRRIIPDVAVVEFPASAAGATTVLEQPRAASRSYQVAVTSELGQHYYVEIRDPSQGHHLVTLIEIVSPSNKYAGPDRESYLRKQREVLQTDANLIEIDLLRGGTRTIWDLFLLQFLATLSPAPDYLVTVNRAWQRNKDASYQVYPFSIREPLPCIEVPLRQGLGEVLVDLQQLFNRAYDVGPYRRGGVDYGQPPVPALRTEDLEWAQALLAQPH